MTKVFATAAGVALLNVALNFLLNSASREESGFLRMLVTWQFCAAFIAGCVSLLTLAYLHSQSIQLSSAMILMAALSLIVGTTVGVIFLSNRPDAFEIALLSLVLIFFLYRWVIIR